MTIDVFAPAQLGPVKLRNRTVKAATFEGRAPHGQVTDSLIDYHLAVARGGVGLTTVAYLAVAPEGRTHHEQIVVGPDTRDGLARMADAIHETGAAIAGQVGHAGPVANGRSNGVKAISASRMPSPLSMQMIRSATEADLTRVTKAYVATARTLVGAGFDVLELHMAHSYLVSSFLAPGLNRRKDGYGGSLENRAKLGRQVARAVRDEVGSEVAVTAKISLSDGFKGGVTTDAYLETLNVLVSLIENTRADLRGHSSHVARLSRKLCERVGLGPGETGAIVSAAYLHDLGKMGAYHLTALNVSEYEGHRVAAEKTLTAPRRLMEGCGLPESTFAAVEAMYERYDGSGLPGQSRGKDIPLGGRLLSIADTFADLTQNPRNPFRKILRPLEACDVLGRYKETIFDPNLVDLFKLTITGDDVKGRLLGDRRLALLVDPDPEETTVLELRMVQQGFLVKIARAADQAVKILESGEIEVVISELDLGGADGFALLEEARKHPWGKDMPWVILTRRQGRQDPQRAFGLGVLDFIAKPANSDLLIAKVKQMLDQRATKTGPRGVSGSLTEMGLPDIVQVLWHGRKSGTLRIKGPHDAGEIHFVEGQIYNALWGKLRGEEAFYAMLLVQEGDFALLPHTRPPARVIEETPEALLLEGMRRMDEGVSAQS